MRRNSREMRRRATTVLKSPRYIWCESCMVKGPLLSAALTEPLATFLSQLSLLLAVPCEDLLTSIFQPSMNHNKCSTGLGLEIVQRPVLEAPPTGLQSPGTDHACVQTVPEASQGLDSLYLLLITIFVRRSALPNSSSPPLEG
ncbi:hypothetical protein TREES_T100014947 [Tupaia chinensis]|uniref:Uncharacterized protein n=1 Tax=Tupaia chinensis TaxID=246437 RepID=L9KNN3_TUPCH|nr:hypothetical protein TREES_T100014947 [Tupaia chinensis]